MLRLSLAKTKTEMGGKLFGAADDPTQGPKGVARDALELPARKVGVAKSTVGASARGLC